MRGSLLKRVFLFASAVATTSVLATVLPGVRNGVAKRQSSTGKLVFCHFMIGIVSNRQSAADYDDDMQRAKALGIDAFALNIGVDPYTDAQLGYAYESAANNDMKVFISFDFNWYSPSDSGAVGSKIATYGSRPGQLIYEDKVFVSSFAGDGLDTAAAAATSGLQVYWAPNFHVGQADFAHLDAAFNWIGWQNNGNNKAPSGGNLVTVAKGDEDYKNALAEGQEYLAPASPWFFTHFGPEVSYSKNWVFPGDLLWYQRWNDILNVQPNFVEIVTWNDYGESHYIGPLSSKHTDDGGSKWVNDMPHAGWLEMSKPYIAAYKAGSTDVSQYITEDKIVYWYRPTSRDLDCDSTDTTMQPANNASGNYFQGRPDGWQTMEDNIYVVPLLTEAGQVIVNSAGTAYTFDAPKGASAFAVPFKVGSQSFSLIRGGSEIMSATSLKVVSDQCPCGLYNFNAYVGTVPESEADPLDSDGLSQFKTGLLSACDATPSLPATPPQTTSATMTIVASAAPTGTPA